ncbi:hypothetical protein APHAL10511_001536 [Amanita phalloides]|nr:hypothetical protein APHAL10511_001536 [Amanita phalloides]
MSNRICHDFTSTGYCRFGEKCRFVHSTERAPTSPIASTSTAAQYNRRQSTVTKNEQPCRFFLKGYCNKGDRCQRSHDLKTGDLIKEANLNTIQQIVLGASALVTCGAGLQVQHMVCGFDCLYITIKNLPQDASRTEVEELFIQQGVDTTLFCVERMKNSNHKIEARVIIEAEIGEALAIGLDGTEFRDDDILDFSVDRDSGPSKMGLVGLGTNWLTVSWKIPTATILFDCYSTSTAQALVDVLHNTIEDGRKIRAVLHKTHGHAVATSVKISNLPTETASAWVRRSPEQCTLTNPLPHLNFDTKIVERDLRRHVLRLTTIEAFEISPPNPSKANAKVRIRFHSWDDVKRAYDSLQAPLKPGYPKFQLSSPKPIQYNISIPLAQYRAQKARWDSISERDDNKAAFVRIDKNTSAFIRVLGEDKKAVGQLKVRVENLVIGETLDVSLWHRWFLTAAGRDFLERVKTRTNGYLRSDWKTKSLKIYADGHAKEAAVKLLEAEVERLRNSETSIAIGRRAVGFFLRKGVPTLKAELGDDAVAFELTSPARLLVRGGEEAHRIVDRLIEESKSGYQVNAENGEGTCPVCFDEPTSPVLLACRHAYCSECIRHYLMSASERKQFPLACAGDEDMCKVPIPISVIKRFLSQQQFEQLLDAAVTSCIEKQPAIFQYCKTPDCTQVYRRDRGKKVLTCPSCFTSVCTGCNKEGHDGMTCEERDLVSNPEEQERRNEQWALTAGAKRCPSCRMFLQKMEGCNHMECPCGAHFCWICLQVFREYRAVYQHMNRVHGGILDEDAQQQQRAREQVDLVYAQQLQREENERAGARVNVAIRHDFDEIWRAQQALRIQEVGEERERNRREEERRAEERRRQERSSWCVIM